MSTSSTITSNKTDQVVTINWQEEAPKEPLPEGTKNFDPSKFQFVDEPASQPQYFIGNSARIFSSLSELQMNDFPIVQREVSKTKIALGIVGAPVVAAAVLAVGAKAVIVAGAASLLSACFGGRTDLEGGEGGPVEPSTNLPVPNTQGVTRNLCDVRDKRDYSSNESKIEGTLRQRIELFNREFEGTKDTDEGECQSGIYFVNPMSIKLKDSLKIRGISNQQPNGTFRGTSINGSRQKDGEPLPVVIDAREVTCKTEKCAFMIEGGLSSFQQIHNITILASDVSQAICDENGNDLMNQPIPDDGSRDCAPGTLARDCDFKGVAVVVDPTCAKNKDDDGDGVPNAYDQCPDTPANVIVNETGCPDSDGDGIFDNEDDCKYQAGDRIFNGCPP